MFQPQTNFITDSVNNYFSEVAKAEQFLDSLKECYQNPKDIFDRVLKINSTVFVSEDRVEKRIKGYLFFNDRENLELNLGGKLTKCIYNGYTLINEGYRQSGALRELLEFSMENFKGVYKSTYKSLLFYAVTSNPIALRGYYKIFKTARPVIDKDLTVEDLNVVAYLKDKLYVSTEVNGHPFTFKTGLPQRYTRSVNETIVNLHIDEQKYLKQLGVNEKKGDRLLFYWTI